MWTFYFDRRSMTKFFFIVDCRLMLPDQKIILTDVQRALTEDIGLADISALLIPASLTVHAIITTRQPMLMCGQAWAGLAFQLLQHMIQIDWLIPDGNWTESNTPLCHIHGQARAILTAERTALNFLQTLSATATQTHLYAQAIQGTHATLLDTRKTLPGLRQAQKYAVRCGGGKNHRMGLYDAYLIKENHIKACGSISDDIAQAKKIASQPWIEIEVENLLELQEALAEKPDRILLDNFSLSMIEAAVKCAKPTGIPLEVSGNVTIHNIKSFADTGVDFISVGAITKSIQAIDLSLRIVS